MRIRIRANASTHYIERCYRHAPPGCGQLHRPEWERMLAALEGKWVEVETRHLFRDQFNTMPIPGVSEQGMRLMLEDIDAIEGDVRADVIKCTWCYGYAAGTLPDGRDYCGNCGRTDHLAPLVPLVPVS